MVVCANADSGGAAKTTWVGAAAQTGGAVSHEHQVIIENEPTGPAQGTDQFGNAVGTEEIPIEAHFHDFSYEGDTSSITNVPPFYALAFIMRVS